MRTPTGAPLRQPVRLKTHYGVDSRTDRSFAQPARTAYRSGLEFYNLWDATLRLGSSVRSLEAPFAHPELGIRARAGAGSDLAGELAETKPAALLGVELGETAAQKKSPARV